MAYLFPDAPVGVLPPVVLRAFQFFKNLPDGYWVWHRLAPWQAAAPDFFLVNPRGQGLLLKVSAAAPAEARPAAQLLLLNDDRPPLGQAEEAALASFIGLLRSDGLPPGSEIAAAVLFPNIPEKSVLESRPFGHPAQPLWLGRERLQPEAQAGWENIFSARPLSELALELVRRRFTPEVIVPPEVTVRAPSPRRLEAGLTGFLLDYDQEAALKTDLALPAEGEMLGRDFRLNVINGVAGSGKSLILLYRLRLLVELYPGRRFLVLTHNRPLIHDLEARFYRLCGRLPGEVSWNTFNGWCRQHWPASPAWVDPLSLARRQGFIRAIWMALFKDNSLTDSMLRSEIDWIKDQVELSREAYLSADRRRRGFRLTQEQRQRVYTAYERYQAVLKEKRVIDWSDVPRRMLAYIKEGKVQPLQYDAVLVDEAQFFAPLWFEIIQRLLKPRSSHLFLAADRTQGFLRQGASWKSLGLEVRGRSYQLSRSYRTTLEILSFATLFYRQRIGKEGEEEEVLDPEMLDLPPGVTPQLIPLSSPQDEITRVVNEIAALAKQGMPRRDILVLHANWEGAAALTEALVRKLGRGAAADPKEGYPGNYVRVTTLNAGTGLESPVVFLVGLHELFEEEQSLRLSDDEREGVIRDNTRKIYMAATRAGQRLVFTYAGRLPEVFERSLEKV